MEDRYDRYIYFNVNNFGKSHLRKIACLLDAQLHK